MTGSNTTPRARAGDRDSGPIPFPGPSMNDEPRDAAPVSRIGRWDPVPRRTVESRPHDAEQAVERAERRLDNLRHILGYDGARADEGPRAA